MLYQPKPWPRACEQWAGPVAKVSCFVVDQATKQLTFCLVQLRKAAVRLDSVGIRLEAEVVTTASGRVSDDHLDRRSDPRSDDSEQRKHEQ